MRRVFTLWQDSKNIQNVPRVRYKLTLYKNGKISYTVKNEYGKRKGVYTLEKYRVAIVLKKLKNIFCEWKEIPSEKRGKETTFKIRFGKHVRCCNNVRKSEMLCGVRELCKTVYDDECLHFNWAYFGAFDDKKSEKENLAIALREFSEQKKNIFYIAYLLRIFTRLNVEVKFDEKLARQYTEEGKCREIPYYLAEDYVYNDDFTTGKFRDFVVTACRRGPAMFRFRNESCGWSDEAMLTLIAQRISI